MAALLPAPVLYVLHVHKPRARGDRSRRRCPAGVAVCCICRISYYNSFFGLSSTMEAHTPLLQLFLYYLSKLFWKNNINTTPPFVLAVAKESPCQFPYYCISPICHPQATTADYRECIAKVLLQYYKIQVRPEQHALPCSFKLTSTLAPSSRNRYVRLVVYLTPAL